MSKTSLGVLLSGLYPEKKVERYFDHILNHTHSSVMGHI